MWDTVKELWIQTRIKTFFWYNILCVLILMTANYRSYMDAQHVERLLYYWRCLFSVLKLDVRYDWRVMAPNMHHKIFPIGHFCVLTRITWKLQVINRRSVYRTTALLSKIFLVLFIVGWDIQLESYGSRHALIILWNNIACISYKPVPSLFGAQLHIITKLMYHMTAHYTPNDGFTANDASFYKSKVGLLLNTLQCLFN